MQRIHWETGPRRVAREIASATVGNANSLGDRVESRAMLVASIVVAGAGVSASDVFRASSWVSPHRGCTFGCYFTPRGLCLV